MDALLAIRSARSLIRSIDRVSDSPGIYAALLDPSWLLAWGYHEMMDFAPTMLGGRAVAYVGGCPTRGLRRRLSDHLLRDCRQSTLRRSLGALLAEHLSLKPIGKPSFGYFHFGAGEAILSEWMSENLSFAFRESTDADHEERAAIKAYRPALNLKEQERSAFAQHVGRLRRTMCLACPAEASPAPEEKGSDYDSDTAPWFLRRTEEAPDWLRRSRRLQANAQRAMNRRMPHRE